MVFSLLKPNLFHLLARKSCICGKTVIKALSTTNSYNEMSGLTFVEVVKKLNEVAPLALASDWDNVGLLIEPSDSLSATRRIKNIMLTNDLTEKVLDEAIEKRIQFIVSYHPPIFVPLKRLCNQDWKQRIAIKCIEERIGVYSPHTALDALTGGVNDWLINALDVNDVKPVIGSKSEGTVNHKVSIQVPSAPISNQSIAKNITDFLEQNQLAYSIVKLSDSSEEISVNCSKNDIPTVISFMDRVSDLRSNVQVVKATETPDPTNGMGRIANFTFPITIGNAVEKIKKYLNLNHVRVAVGAHHTLDSTVKTFAVCAGSGSSVLKGVAADLILSGEMSHHQVLDFVHNNTSVILCDHSNTERGYLGILAERLENLLQEGGVKVILSQTDDDPLTVI